MKRLHTLCLTLCMLCVFALTTVQPSFAQESSKVVVIKKKTDANGQQIVEKVIVTDDENAEEIFLELNDINMDNAVNHENRVTRHSDLNKVSCEDHKKSVSLSCDKNVFVNVNEDNGEKVIEINVDGEKETIRLAKGEDLPDEDRERLAAKGVHLNHLNGVTWVGKDARDFNFDFNIDLEGVSEGVVAMSKHFANIAEFEHAFAYAYDDINCAALGVYVSSHRPSGVYVSSTIGSSGAEEAGLKRGDVITAINDDETTSYSQLHWALAKYEPGDVVAVTYLRDGIENRVETQLRAWRDFPSFANSRHALVTCDQEAIEEVTKKIIVIKKDRVEEIPEVPENVNQSPLFEPILNNLDLHDFVAFPNPTDGKFNVQFSAEAVPTIVSVFDASGREIFRDNLDNFNGYYNREVDLTSAARGALVLSVEQDGKSFTEQIVLH